MCLCVDKWIQKVSFPLLFGGAGFAAWSLWSPATAAWLMPVIVAAVAGARTAVRIALERQRRCEGGSRLCRIDGAVRPHRRSARLELRARVCGVCRA